jgi:PhnB protein
MAALSPYINFKGNCEEAFNFYKSVFGGDFPYVGRYKDMPPSETEKAGEVDGNLIMHISLQIGKDSYLMGSDVGGEWAKYTTEGNNIQLSLNADDEAHADKLFAALSAGGRANMPMQKTFWGSYFGMLTDKFGINWMISSEPKRDDKAGQN